jgi:hypothetical protein
MTVDALYELAAARRHGGQSPYAPPGERSVAQRQADVRDLFGIVERVGVAAGRWALMQELGCRTEADLWQLRADALLHRIERERRAGLYGVRWPLTAREPE